MQPGVGQGEILGMKAENPGRVVLQNTVHAVNDRRPLRAVVHVLHFGEQAVRVGVDIVGSILAAAHALGLVAGKQEEKILRVGVVGVPAEEIDLRCTLAQFFLKSVEIGRANDQLDIKLGELAHQPVVAWFVVDAATGRIEVEYQRLAGTGVPPIGPTRFGQ